ncbi:hypothetical protein Ocin01_18682 [Orchesella cincta]|uniref:Uncharacterized protein n=1 Tax=Orchesella cincta TaxID=48709 RepID=A0A1D2M4U7_ORCCI|nr:hypothetical protein Ocin01_18682 [Orchesella cincta]
MKIFGIIATLVAFVCVVVATPGDAPKTPASGYSGTGGGTTRWK